MKLIVALAAVLTSAALTVPTVAEVNGDASFQAAGLAAERAARA